MQESGIEKAIGKICTNYSLKYSKFEIIMAKKQKHRRKERDSKVANKGILVNGDDFALSCIQQLLTPINDFLTESSKTISVQQND